MCIAHSFRAFAHNDLKMEKIAFVDANNNFEAIKILYQNCTFFNIILEHCAFIHATHCLGLFICVIHRRMQLPLYFPEW